MPTKFTDSTQPGKFDYRAAASNGELATPVWFGIGNIKMFQVNPNLSEGGRNTWSLFSVQSAKPNATSIGDAERLNITAFLMAIDDDNDWKNGIQIAPATAGQAVGLTINFQQSWAQFSVDPSVTTTVSALTASTRAGRRALPSVGAAQLASTGAWTSTFVEGDWTLVSGGTEFTIRMSPSQDLSVIGYGHCDQLTQTRVEGLGSYTVLPNPTCDLTAPFLQLINFTVKEDGSGIVSWGSLWTGTTAIDISGPATKK